METFLDPAKSVSAIFTGISSHSFYFNRLYDKNFTD